VWGLEDQGNWELAYPELSFSIWKLWKSTDYQMPLWGSKGILEWPDWFMHDATLLNWLNRMIRRDMKLED
jgi:hypothetical protein